MERYLDRFHAHKEIFAPFRLPKKTKAKDAQRKADLEMEERAREDEEIRKRLEQIKARRRKAKYFDTFVADFTADKDLHGSLEISQTLLDSIAELEGEGENDVLDRFGLFRIIKLHLLLHFSKTISESVHCSSFQLKLARSCIKVSRRDIAKVTSKISSRR